MIATALCFDFGLRNIGVAYGQSLTGTAQPLSPLKANQGTPRWDEVAQLIKEWRPQLFVVGLPLNMDDTESDLSERARNFGQQLYSHYGLAVEFMDERLTSFAVKQNAAAEGHKGNYKDQPVDSLAAQMILEDWFRHKAATDS